jgi:predicted DNA-binding transcriptional regulator YafY
MKTSRISRVVKILTTLQSGQSYSADSLARLLNVSRRTVFRDLNELQKVGVPYHYDLKDGGYRVEPEFFLPPVDLTLQEALSLCLVIDKVRQHMQIPFNRSAVMAAHKIENNLPATIRDYCRNALRHVSIQPNATAPVQQLDKVFSQLQRAIMQKRKVKIAYSSLYEREEITTDLSPYHLMYHSRAWYVLGRSSLHESVRTFKLNRIKTLEVLSQGFLEENFDVDEYLGRAWAMIPEGQIYNVKLRFLPKVAANVSEVRWHSTQKVSHNPDGSVTMEFRVDGLWEISWWIMGYGNQVQVLAPAALRQRVTRMAQGMIELNRQTGPEIVDIEGRTTKTRKVKSKKPPALAEQAGPQTN